MIMLNNQLYDWVFQTALFSTIGALRAPVLGVNPPAAGKSKPPAVRVVVDFIELDGLTDDLRISGLITC